MDKGVRKSNENKSMHTEEKILDHLLPEKRQSFDSQLSGYLKLIGDRIQAFDFLKNEVTGPQ